MVTVNMLWAWHAAPSHIGPCFPHARRSHPNIVAAGRAVLGLGSGLPPQSCSPRSESSRAAAAGHVQHTTYADAKDEAEGVVKEMWERHAQGTPYKEMFVL